MYPEGPLDVHMEGLGHSLAILTGVAGAQQAASILQNQYVSQYGIPCVWPVFVRFRSDDGMSFGRHNGTVWPHIQGFWATAAAMHRNIAIFAHELDALAQLADRHGEFKEIYHPITGEPYGGLQIDRGEMRLWDSQPRQTWSATAYLRMIHMGLFGMAFDPEGIRFQPVVPERFKKIALTGLAYRDMTLDIIVNGSGVRVEQFKLDGEPSESQRVSAAMRGRHMIELEMA